MSPLFTINVLRTIFSNLLHILVIIARKNKISQNIAYIFGKRCLYFGPGKVQICPVFCKKQFNIENTWIVKNY